MLTPDNVITVPQILDGVIIVAQIHYEVTSVAQISDEVQVRHDYLMTGLEEESMSCSTVTAGVSSRVVTSFMLQMARAASTVTMSFLCLRQLSRKS